MYPQTLTTDIRSALAGKLCGAVLTVLLFMWAGMSPFLLRSCAEAAERIPPPGERVFDPNNVLGGSYKDVVSQLRGLQLRTGSEIGVVILPSLQEFGDGLTVEQYAIKVAENWKLGRKGVDDGALLLVALQEREVRIEVGRGLEGDIPDAVAKRIIEDQMKPHFKGGDIRRGVVRGVECIIAIIEKSELPPPHSRSTDRTDAPTLQVTVGLVAVGLFFTALLGAVIAGLLMGITGYFLAFAMLGLGHIGAFGFGALVAFFVWIFSFLQGSAGGPGGYRGYGSGGFGGLGGGGSFGGFGSGGGFSGGGASGRW